MGASRTRQTRAVVSYKLDTSSSDDSGDDVGFAPTRSTRKETVRGSNGGELEASNVKGRRSLALKKNRNQDRGEVRDEGKAQARNLDQNCGKQQGDVSADWAPLAVPGEFETTDRNVLPETRTTAFQHLVDAAFDATDMKRIDFNEDNGGAVEDVRQSSAAGEESANQHPEVETSHSSQDDQGELKLSTRSDLKHGVDRGHDAESTPPKTARTGLKKSSKTHQAGSDDDDDDWLDDDVGDGDISDSASDFSNENASDSDVDIERPAKKRQSTKTVAKEPSITKGPRTKSGAADRKPGTIGRKVENTKAPVKSVGRPRKLVSPSVIGLSSSVEGTGATPCIRRLQPVKMRLKMASKEDRFDGSSCGSAGGVPTQLISSNNLQHRRVLGLSRRCRPPPLHPYLTGT